MLSLSPLCFIFGCLLCLSAVISHDDLKGAGFDLRDLERISILLCSKCFLCHIWKRIHERADTFLVALFLSCKDLCRKKSNLQSDDIRTRAQPSKEADPSRSGSCQVKVIKSNKRLYFWSKKPASSMHCRLNAAVQQRSVLVWFSINQSPNLMYHVYQKKFNKQTKWPWHIPFNISNALWMKLPLNQPGDK